VTGAQAISVPGGVQPVIMSAAGRRLDEA